MKIKAVKHLPWDRPSLDLGGCTSLPVCYTPDVLSGVHLQLRKRVLFCCTHASTKSTRASELCTPSDLIRRPSMATSRNEKSIDSNVGKTRFATNHSVRTSEGFDTERRALLASRR